MPRLRLTGPLSLGQGIHLTMYRYLRIHVVGRWRMWYAHRAYAARQMEASGHKLTDRFEVDHQCRNPLCWPPTDFHLCVMERALHDAASGGNHRIRWGKKRSASGEL